MKRIRRFLIPLIIVEVLSRFAGYFAEILLPPKAYAIEVRLRAALTNLRFGSRLRELGRGVILARAERMSFAPDVTIRNHVVIMTGDGTFSIGRGSHISHHSVMAAGGNISIGEDCAISSGVVIYSITNQPAEENKLIAERPPLKAEVRIGNSVHIGANVTILPGVVIGDRAVVGAGAVVNTDVRAGSRVAGVPARELV